MAMIPDPNALDRRTPSARTTIAQVQTGAVERATTNAAAQNVASTRANTNSLVQFGSNVAELAEREKMRLDDLAVDDYRNKAVEASTRRSVEAQAVSGGDVLKDDYIKKQINNLDKDNDALTKGLMNESQKAKAKGWYDQFRTGFGKEVTMHAVRETDKYEKSVFDGTVRSYTNLGVQAPTNSDMTITAVEGVRNAVIAKLTKDGAAPVDIETQAVEAAGATHRQIIDALREQGAVGYANQYLKENIMDMSAKQATDAQESLRRVTEYEQGTAIGEQAFSMASEGKTPVEIDAFMKSQKLSDGAKRVAQSVLQDSQVAQRKANDETSGGLYMAFRGTDMSAAAMGGLVRSSAFTNLSKVEQDATYAHLDQIRRMADQQNDENRREAEDRTSNSPKSIALIGELLDQPDVLARMSNAQITALEPTVGNTNVGKLMAVKNSTLKGAAKFTIAPALVNEALAAVTDKEDAKVLRGSIAMKLMDFKEQNPGVLPTPEQQAEIVRTGQETWVSTNWLNTEKPAYKVKKGQGYPLEFKNKYFPNDENDDTIIDAYGDMLEKYAKVQKNARVKGKIPPTQDQVMRLIQQQKTTKQAK